MVQSDQTPTGDYDQHSGDVYGWAYRILGHHHDALDVVQDVFLKWTKQRSHAPPREARGWLRRVTINRAIDLQRAQRLKPVDRRGLEHSTSPAARDESALTETDVGTLRADIVSALDRLTEVQRGVLVAKIYDELTFAAIAGELDLSVSTVKTHYLRGIRAVRDHLHSRWSLEYAT